MVTQNFKLYTKFTQIFLKLQQNLNPLTAETERLKREYQTYAYKKPTWKMRGLEMEDDSTDQGPKHQNSNSSKLLCTDEESKTKEEDSQYGGSVDTHRMIDRMLDDLSPRD
jgi:hypothetical protein